MEPRILRPHPRRPFDLNTISNESSVSPTPMEQPDMLSPNGLTDPGSASTTVSRTGSILNLTSSTLYGIYQPTAFGSLRDEASPWGTEANSPTAEFSPEPSQAAALKSAIEPRPLALRRTRSRLSHGLFRGVILPQALSSAMLFGFGLVYGIITVHLHENHWITPVKLENVHYYNSWKYLLSWGIAGIVLGNLLPWLDSWRETDDVEVKLVVNNEHISEEDEDSSSGWVTMTRSVGAFVGIAFAMRRLQWQSTTQASVTLALANPVLWYLIDRTQPGFILSVTVCLAGMGAILGLKPELIPASTGPSVGSAFLNGTGWENTLGAGITQESIAVHTWIASVIFCACVCFGNIGRQLAIGARKNESLKA